MRVAVVDGQSLAYRRRRSIIGPVYWLNYGTPKLTSLHAAEASCIGLSKYKYRVGQKSEPQMLYT